MSHRILVALCSTALLTGCLKDPGGPTQDLIDKATVTTFPSAPISWLSSLLTALGIGTTRDGFLYVPANYNPTVPAPLMVLLHGAGSSAAFFTTPEMLSTYDALGLVVLALDSRGLSWDGVTSRVYEVDIDFMELALAQVYTSVNVDPDRIGIGGFSDGATEAIGVGAANSGLFRFVAAFSPGQPYMPFTRGPLPIFISHGTEDPVLSYNLTEGQTVPRLRQNGFPVQFVSFTGGHELPANIFTQGLSAFVTAEP